MRKFKDSGVSYLNWLLELCDQKQNHQRKYKEKAQIQHFCLGFLDFFYHY